jgi:hypothetical protein
MESNQKNFDRNRPADKGRGNDPFVRDDSAQQPGVNTMSDSSNNDRFNERITKTTGDNNEDPKYGADADPTFDQIGEEDENNG